MPRISMQGPLKFHRKDEWQDMYAVIVDYTLAYYANKEDLIAQNRPIEVIPLNSTQIKEIKDPKQSRDKRKCKFLINHDHVCFSSTD